MGQSDQEQDQDQQHGGLKADLSGKSQIKSRFSVGAGLPAKNLRTPRSFRTPASSLTTIAGKPAPTGDRARCSF
jgi:hypothetical protein